MYSGPSDAITLEYFVYSIIYVSIADLVCAKEEENEDGGNCHSK
jgi:hypothetical protein